jgi:hypothetical protein
MPLFFIAVVIFEIGSHDYSQDVLDHEPPGNLG